MTSFKATSVLTATCAGIAMASAAAADVTSDQVWADWQSYMAASGYDISATETRSGDSLVVSDIQGVLAVPEEDVTVQLSISEITFTDNGDGTVSVSIPNSLPMRVTVDDPSDEDVDIGMTYATKGWSMIASGAPNDMVYTYSAAEIGVTIDEVTVEGGTVDMSEFGTVEFLMANLAGSSQSQTSDVYSVKQKLTTGAVSYLVDVTDPEGSGDIRVEGGADGVDTDMELILPLGVDTQDIYAMLERGFSVGGDISFNGGRLDFNFTEDGEAVQFASSSDVAEFQIAMNSEELVYGISSEGQDISVVGGEVPFPVELSAETSGFMLQVPVSASDDLQDFAMDFEIGDFEMTDLLWGIFDPTGQLPRDPATISLALNGVVKLFVDFMDPEQAAMLDSGDTIPGEIHELNIEGLTVRAAGAELTGDGAFTFDNSDMTTFDGMPAPTGSLNLMLRGGNALLDTLVSMGLVPEQEAAGARMMMGLFAVAGAEPDTLNSTIEVQGNGQIFANGQRIQ